MATKQEQLKRALKQWKKKIGPEFEEKEEHFQELIQRKETSTSIKALAFDHQPKTFKEKRDILHFQWLQGARFMKRTDTKRVALDQYNGSWVRLAGVVSEAKIIRGVLRICIAAPEVVQLDQGKRLERQPVDSHLWIKMNQLVLNDEPDVHVDNRPTPADSGTHFSSGVLSLGDYFTVDALIEPYVNHGKVKYGVAKIKNISVGYLMWQHIRNKRGYVQHLEKYPRVGWLVKAKKIEGTSKFSYQFADWEEIEKQKNFFESYQSSYSIVEKREKRC